MQKPSFGFTFNLATIWKWRVYRECNIVNFRFLREMATQKKAFISKRVLLDGEIKPACIEVQNGQVCRVLTEGFNTSDYNQVSPHLSLLMKLCFKSTRIQFNIIQSEKMKFEKKNIVCFTVNLIRSRMLGTCWLCLGWWMPMYTWMSRGGRAGRGIPQPLGQPPQEE